MKKNTIIVLAIIVVVVVIAAIIVFEGPISSQPAAVVSAPGFTLLVQPSSGSLAYGTSGTSRTTILVSAVNGFSGPVALSPSGACGTNSISCSLSSSTVAPTANANGSTVLIVTTLANTPAGTYPIKVSARGGAALQSTTFTLQVSKSQNDFTISVNPSTLNVTPTSVAMVESGSVVLGSIGGSSTVKLSTSGLPTGVTFSSQTSVAAPSTDPLQLTVAPTVAAGTYPITITGTNGIETHTSTLTLIVK